MEDQVQQPARNVQVPVQASLRPGSAWPVVELDIVNVLGVAALVRLPLMSPAADESRELAQPSRI